MVADLDENVPFRIELERLMYPLGTRGHRGVYMLENERRALAGLSEESSHGLEPSTPSLTTRSGEGSAGTGGSSRARKRRKPKGSDEET
jgi:hypothetical protein